MAASRRVESATAPAARRRTSLCFARRCGAVARNRTGRKCSMRILAAVFLQRSGGEPNGVERYPSGIFTRQIRIRNWPSCASETSAHEKAGREERARDAALKSACAKEFLRHRLPLNEQLARLSRGAQRV